MQQQKTQAFNWFCTLRDKIVEAFCLIEKQSSKDPKIETRQWERPGGGGGESTVIYGNVFEKVGINVSKVYGTFGHLVRKEIPGANESNGEFWASGISLVSHMQSPLIPAAHMNTRLIYTANQWFGGGMDFTPIYPNIEESNYIHTAIKNQCDTFDKNYYPQFKEQCDQYFFLPHRKESRGIGGIFYDNFNSGNWTHDFQFTQSVGEIFLKIYSHIIYKNMHQVWTQKQREDQIIKRGRYVEFNLLYDRGTKFGLMTEGDPDAIMMSLPPLVKWI
ncbi:oxygen-dependent coproporphyrinogen oxidase [Wolbachia endosymbiont of Howardula sp.]|uniref:oxygen-dependent coproporphyrinogen oxidase n=1 Tax=Wolbachia endosymbiont of Howardula sp. TaxID=2916816 RepID=UPI00217E0FE4|nr:oxygen-dependent coproporphyrinogen oxidase [Wolbachia endosymbiont of Howardula sp.]UWI83401.1 oxygen-dependent coproporphyrinogen oxidase [Wolbachia endosymbiont of Howardula sp.]